jgi:hypothetical protein
MDQTSWLDEEKATISGNSYLLIEVSNLIDRSHYDWSTYSLVTFF